MKCIGTGIVAFLFLIGCHDPASEQPAGVWVSAHRTAYTIAADTLVIHMVAGSDNRLLIERSLQIRFTGAAAGRATETKQMRWAGSYDADQKRLLVPVSGRSLWYYPGSGQLMMGNSVYQRIKNIP